MHPNRGSGSTLSGLRYAQAFFSWSGPAACTRRCAPHGFASLGFPMQFAWYTDPRGTMRIAILCLRKTMDRPYATKLPHCPIGDFAVDVHCLCRGQECCNPQESNGEHKTMRRTTWKRAACQAYKTGPGPTFSYAKEFRNRSDRITVCRRMFQRGTPHGSAL